MQPKKTAQTYLEYMVHNRSILDVQQQVIVRF